MFSRTIWSGVAAVFIGIPSQLVSRDGEEKPKAEQVESERADCPKTRHIEFVPRKINRALDAVDHFVESRSNFRAVQANESIRAGIACHHTGTATQQEVRVPAPSSVKSKWLELGCKFLKFLLEIKFVTPCPRGEKLQGIERNSLCD